MSNIQQHSSIVRSFLLASTLLSSGEVVKAREVDNTSARHCNADPYTAESTQYKSKIYAEMYARQSHNEAARGENVLSEEDKKLMLLSHGIAPDQGTRAQRARAAKLLYDLKPEISNVRSRKDLAIIEELLRKHPAVHSNVSWQFTQFVQQNDKLKSILGVNFRSYGLDGPYAVVTEKTPPASNTGKISIEKAEYNYTPEERLEAKSLLILYAAVKSLKSSFPDNRGVDAAIVEMRQNVHIMYDNNRNVLYAIREYVKNAKLNSHDKNALTTLLFDPDNFSIQRIKGSFVPSPMKPSDSETAIKNITHANTILNTFSTNSAIYEIIAQIENQVKSLNVEEKNKIKTWIAKISTDAYNEKLLSAVLKGITTP